jgi:hypothetical protein
MISRLQNEFRIDLDHARDRLSTLTYSDMGVDDSDDLWLGHEPVDEVREIGLHDDILRALAELPLFGDGVDFSYHWVSAYDSSVVGHLVLTAGPSGMDNVYAVAIPASTHTLANCPEGVSRTEFALEVYATAGEALKSAIDAAAG